MWFSNPIGNVSGAKMAAVDASGVPGYVSGSALGSGGTALSWGSGLSYALGVVSVTFGTGANTAAAGNDQRIVGALQSGAIPAGAGKLLGGTGTAGAAGLVTIGAGLSLSAGVLSAASGGYTLPAATVSSLGGIKPGAGLSAASDGTLTLANVSPSIIAQGGASVGQLLGWTGTSWAPTSVTVGSGSGGYTLPVATLSTLGGVKVDGSTLTAASDGTLSVVGTGITALTDIATLGGPALSDVDVLNRGGTDYKTALSASVALFRKTPAGSRTVTLATGALSATLTAADNDKTVVVSGVTGGTLTVDGTITDGFRCQVINHSAGTLALSGIAALGSATLDPGTVAFITLSASAVEAAIIPTAVAVAALGSAGTPLGTDVFVLNRGGVDLQTPLSAVLAQAAPATLPAFLNVGISGVVATLPGGAGTAVYRYVFARPCTFAAGLATPYAVRGRVGTNPAAAASFGLARLPASGSLASIGSLSISTAGAFSASFSAAVTFAAGDELIVTAPSPADTLLADVTFTVSGAWG